MEIRILLDHDIEGYDVYIETGLRETGWDQVFITSSDDRTGKHAGLLAGHHGFR
jgi:hypothetical protein